MPISAPYIKPTLGFWLSFTSLLLFPVFFPKLHLFFFVPYLVIALYRFSRVNSLWRSLGCGLILDLFSSTPFFGLTSLNYTLVASLLYGQTRNFFEDKLSTLPLMTFLFSFLSTLFSLILSLFSGTGHTLSVQWIVTDLFVMPSCDAAYALLVFSFPFQLLYKLKKMRLRT